MSPASIHETAGDYLVNLQVGGNLGTTHPTPTMVPNNFLHPGAAEIPLDGKSHEIHPGRWNLQKGEL